MWKFTTDGTIWITLSSGLVLGTGTNHKIRFYAPDYYNQGGTKPSFTLQGYSGSDNTGTTLPPADTYLTVATVSVSLTVTGVEDQPVLAYDNTGLNPLATSPSADASKISLVEDGTAQQGLTAQELYNNLNLQLNDPDVGNNLTKHLYLTNFNNGTSPNHGHNGRWEYNDGVAWNNLNFGDALVLSASHKIRFYGPHYFHNTGTKPSFKLQGYSGSEDTGKLTPPPDATHQTTNSVTVSFEVTNIADVLALYDPSTQLLPPGLLTKTITVAEGDLSEFTAEDLYTEIGFNLNDPDEATDSETNNEDNHHLYLTNFVDASAGVWEYNDDTGNACTVSDGWCDIPTTGGFVLKRDDMHKIRFNPTSEDYYHISGTLPGFTLQGYSQPSATTGIVGQGTPPILAPASSDLSMNNVRMSLEVTDVPNRPVLSGALATVTIPEDPTLTQNPGVVVSDVGTSSAGDRLLTAYDTKNMGQWQYCISSCTSESSWVDLTTTISSGNGLYFPAAYKIRFKPNTNANTAGVSVKPSISVRAWVALSSPSFLGEVSMSSYSVSTADVTLQVTITSVDNDSPVLRTSSGADPTPTDVMTVQEDDNGVTLSGLTAAEIYNSLSLRLDDPDVGSYLSRRNLHLYLSNFNKGAPQAHGNSGRWQYYDGSNWNDVPTGGFVLRNSHQIRFYGAHYFHESGDKPTFTLQGYSDDSPFTTGTSSLPAATHLSSNSVEVSLDVTRVDNDPPLLRTSSGADPSSTDEITVQEEDDELTVSGITAANLYDSLVLRLDDPDLGTNLSNSHLYLSGFDRGDQQVHGNSGVWQYHDGSSWLDVPGGFVLRQDDKIRFYGAHYFHSTGENPQFTLRGYSGNLPTGTRTLPVGDLSISSNSVVVFLEVTNVEDIPLLRTSSGANLSSRDQITVQENDIEVTFNGITADRLYSKLNLRLDDPDVGADQLKGLYLSGFNNGALQAHGHSAIWQYHDASNWIDVPSGGFVLLKDDKIRLYGAHYFHESGNFPKFTFQGYSGSDNTGTTSTPSATYLSTNSVEVSLNVEKVDDPLALYDPSTERLPSDPLTHTITATEGDLSGFTAEDLYTQIGFTLNDPDEATISAARQHLYLTNFRNEGISGKWEYTTGSAWAPVISGSRTHLVIRRDPSHKLRFHPTSEDYYHRSGSLPGFTLQGYLGDLLTASNASPPTSARSTNSVFMSLKVTNVEDLTVLRTIPDGVPPLTYEITATEDDKGEVTLSGLTADRLYSELNLRLDDPDAVAGDLSDRHLYLSNFSNGDLQVHGNRGRWQYHDGASWNDVPTGGFVLRKDDKIRFYGTHYFYASRQKPRFTFQGYSGNDNTGTTSTPDAIYLSSNTVGVSLNISPADDDLALYNPSTQLIPTGTLTHTITTTEGDLSGLTAEDLYTQIRYNLNDPDEAMLSSSDQHLYLTNFRTESISGQWEYTIGDAWIPVVSSGVRTHLVLQRDPSHKLRFRPTSEDYYHRSGTLPGFTLQGYSGDLSTASNTAPPSSDQSTNSVSISLEVSNVLDRLVLVDRSDALVAISAASSITLLEDDGPTDWTGLRAKEGFSAEELYVELALRLHAPDLGTSLSNTHLYLSDFDVGVTQRHGHRAEWQYHDGSSWKDVPSSAFGGFVLQNSHRIRYYGAHYFHSTGEKPKFTLRGYSGNLLTGNNRNLSVSELSSNSVEVSFTTTRVDNDPSVLAHDGVGTYNYLSHASPVIQIAEDEGPSPSPLSSSSVVVSGLKAKDGIMAQQLYSKLHLRLDDPDLGTNLSNSHLYLSGFDRGDQQVHGNSGVWQYHDGSSWLDVPGGFVLRQDDKIRFYGAHYFHESGDKPNFTLQGYSGSDNTGTTSPPDVTHLSSNSLTVSFEVTNVEDSPVLRTSSGLVPSPTYDITVLKGNAKVTINGLTATQLYSRLALRLDDPDVGTVLVNDQHVYLTDFSQGATTYIGPTAQALGCGLIKKKNVLYFPEIT